MKTRLLIAICLIFVTAAGAHPGDAEMRRPRCDRALRHRTAAEVLASHFANLAAGDYEAERCNYSKDAVVISDGGVTKGVDDIVSSLAGLGAIFGGQVPVVNEEVIVSILDSKTEMARTLFSIETACVDIPDGTDTYIIRNGRIEAQTAHGFPVFKCGPPPGPPPTP